MDFKKFFSRIRWVPYGFIRGVLEMANDKARDIENKRRFPHANIDQKCSFTLDSTIGFHSHVLRGATVNHSHIGSYSYLNYNCLLQNATIGNYCSISHHVVIGLGAHPLDLFSTSPVFFKSVNALGVQLLKEDLDFVEYSPILVGSDVWIGANVVVMDGVNIGHGAVLAAGAVVTKDVPPYAIVGGVPAKVIKYRFTEEVRDLLLKSKWWDKKAEEVFAIREELQSICKGQNYYYTE